jgi:hypothetical protein
MVECLPERLEDRQILGVAEKRNRKLLVHRQISNTLKKGVFQMLDAS